MGANAGLKGVNFSTFWISYFSEKDVPRFGCCSCVFCKQLSCKIFRLKSFVINIDAQLQIVFLHFLTSLYHLEKFHGSR